ncbi:MAG: 5-formyltetrahydrofolate cyclo-ligase [Euryarchaeota archaeon]|nr:5-formyltetrahydrofolate cyclo-ligase [Euryarchaeota archaeon]
MDTKHRIRRKVLAWRNDLPEWDLRRRSVLIGENLFKLSDFMDSRTVMFYNSKASEVKTDDMVRRALADGKRVVVPVMDTQEYQLFLSELWDFETELAPGAFQVPEPKEECIRPVAPEEVDIFILPGVAFDRKGNRLGFGGGYFDKLLKQTKKGALFIGLAFEDQMVDAIPHAPHDIPVHMVITEDRVVRCRAKI